MKWVRFQDKNQQPAYGILDGNTIRQISGSMYGSYQETGICFSREEVKLLVPCEPTKLFCIGSNYLDHIKELGLEIPERPATFMKPVTSAIPSGEKIVIPPSAQRVDYEGELGIVIRDVTCQVTPEQAKEHIFGVVACNDVTERSLMKWPLQLTYGKSFDTFAPILRHYIASLSQRSDTMRSWRGAGAVPFSANSSGTVKRTRSMRASKEPDSSTRPGTSSLSAVHTWAS